MKIRFIDKPILRNKIKDKYVSLYRESKRVNPDNGYTRQKLQQNISNVLSVGRYEIEDTVLRTPTISKWAEKGWKIFTFNHWYFAVVQSQDARGKLFLEIQDCCYEGDYHNVEKMDTTPYGPDESYGKNDNSLLIEFCYNHIPLKEHRRRLIYINRKELEYLLCNITQQVINEVN